MIKIPLLWHPRVYNIRMLILHGRNLRKKYEYISKQIGKNKVVLEPGCGSGLLANYLDKTCKYIGFDIDPRFVKYCKKRGLNAYEGNALTEKSYKKADVIVLCDVVHHIGRKDEQKMFKLCKKSAKKIIICEQPVVEIYKRIPFYAWIYNLIEQDKAGKVNFVLQRTEKQLVRDMRNGFGVIKTKKIKLKRIGKDLIVIYG